MTKDNIFQDGFGNAKVQGYFRIKLCTATAQTHLLSSGRVFGDQKTFKRLHLRFRFFLSQLKTTCDDHGSAIDIFEFQSNLGFDFGLMRQLWVKNECTPFGIGWQVTCRSIFETFDDRLYKHDYIAYATV